MSRLGPQPGERIDRTQQSPSPSTASRSRPTRATRSARRCTPPASAPSAAASSTTAPGGLCVCRVSARTASARSTARPGRGRASSRCARGSQVEHVNARALARVRRDARHRHRRRPVHPARLLLQDVHPPAQAVAAVREDPAQRRRPGQAAPRPARARVAHRVPPPPRRRARRRRRDRRPERGDRGRRSWAPTPCSSTRGPSPAASSCSAGGLARAGRACPRRRRGDPRARLGAGRLRRPGARSGRATRCTRSAPRATCSPPARSSSRSCSPATTCPGVMLTRRRAPAGRPLRRQPGRRAVIATTSDRGLEAARALRAAGVEIVAVADLRPALNERRAGAAPRRRAGVRRPHGDRGARQQAGRAGGASRRSARRRRARVRCDLVVVSGGAIPASSLLLQAGAQQRLRRAPRALRALRAARRRLRRRRGGRRRTATRRRPSPASSPAARPPTRSARATRESASAHRDRAQLADAAAPDVAVAPPVERRGARQVLRLPVRGRDQQGHRTSAIDEGYDSIELSKRYTTVTMGPCQGRMCQLPAVRLMAEETGQSLAQVGVTTARPAVGLGADGHPRRPPGRAGQALVHPRPPPRARRDRQVGRRLAAGLRLRRPRGRGAGRQPGRRADRRLHAGQADRPRPRRRRVPRSPVSEPLLEPQARPHPLRRDQLRRRADRRRRHDLPARRRDLLRDHDLERRRRRRGVVLAGGWPTGATGST